MPFHQTFISAIHSKNKKKLTFYSYEDGDNLVRVCAPIDHAVGRIIRDKVPRYWYWDYGSDIGKYPLGMKSNQIVSIELLDQHFNPSEFITWNTKIRRWTISRDWGEFSLNN